MKSCRSLRLFGRNTWIEAQARRSSRVSVEASFVFRDHRVLAGQVLVNFPAHAALRSVVIFSLLAMSKGIGAPVDLTPLGAVRWPWRFRCFLVASCLQADEETSSDDDHLSEAAGSFDLSLSARKPVSTPTRGEQARVSEDDFNVLDSFDLPEEALQDKVRIKLVVSYILRSSRLCVSLPSIQTHLFGVLVFLFYIQHKSKLCVASVCRPGTLTRSSKASRAAWGMCMDACMSLPSTHFFLVGATPR